LTKTAQENAATAGFRFLIEGGTNNIKYQLVRSKRNNNLDF